MSKSRRSYICVPVGRNGGAAPACRSLEASRRPREAGGLRAYCSFAYLYPGFHPDCWEDWDGLKTIRPLGERGVRRAAAGKLTDNELYPYQATKAAIARARQEARLR